MSLCVIVSHWSPCGYETPRRNLESTLQWIASQNLPCVFVQACGPGQSPVEAPSGSRIVRHVVSVEGDCPWLKENLWNIGASLADTDKLAFIDADVYFSDPLWHEKTEALLRNCDVVQPFESAVWLDKDGKASMTRKCAAAAIAAGDEPDVSTHHPGFAWAMTRAAFTRLGGFYDRCVLGQGDIAIAYAISRVAAPAGSPWSMTPSYKKYKARAECLRLRAGFVPGVSCLHLWHGEVADRQYEARDTLLPASDNGEYPLLHRDDGVLSWSEQKPRKAVREYFESRQEDGRDAVAVVIPCHNYGQYLADCIESALRQTVPAAEIVVVDDASTDNTAEVAGRYPVKYLRYEHKSCFLSRKAGLLNTTSPFVVFLDADDQLCPTYIQECLDAFRGKPRFAICSPNIQMFGDSDELYESVVGNIELANWITSASLVRRAAIEESQAFKSEHLPDDICEDWFVWKRVLRSGRWKAHKIRKPLVRYRKHGTSRWGQHFATGSHYTHAGLAVEPITAIVTIRRRRDWSLLADWLRRNQQVEEVIAIDNAGVAAPDLGVAVSVVPPQRVEDCVAQSRHEFILVADQVPPKDSVETLLRGLGYGETAKAGNGCRLVRRSTLKSRPITAAIVTPALTVGGAEQWIRSLVTLSDPRDIQWRVALTEQGRWHPSIVGPIGKIAELYAVGGDMPNSRRFPDAKSAIAASQEGADIVVAWGENYWPMPTSLPVVMAGHGACEYTKRLLATAFKAGVSHIVCVSEKSKNNTTTAEMKASVIWNSIDPERLRLTRTPEDVRINSWKIDRNWFYPENVYVGFIGRLAVEKNPLLIARAVAELPHQFKCVLVGDGLAARETVAKAKEILNDESYARFFYSPAVEDVGNHFNALDAAVAVSQSEGNSLSLIEAMLCGCPIVTTRVGAVEEFERAAGQELFISLPEMPTVSEIAVGIRKAASEGRSSPRVAAARQFAEKNLVGPVMAKKWTKYLTDIVLKNQRQALP